MTLQLKKYLVLAFPPTHAQNLPPTISEEENLRFFSLSTTKVLLFLFNFSHPPRPRLDQRKLCESPQVLFNFFIYIEASRDSSTELHWTPPVALI